MPKPHAPSVPVLPAALVSERMEIDVPGGRLSCYADSAMHARDATPLLLVHSVNAAASAYEVKPLFDHYRRHGPVYAIDLPGYGFSDRADRVYTPRLMTDAVIALAATIAERHGGAPIDALAVSLAAEFLARAAVEQPLLFRSVALVSATGLDRRGPYEGESGSDRGKRWLLAGLGRAPWSEAVYRLLTKPAVIRWFLEKTWGSKNIDEGLLAYDVLTTKQPGASHAPFYFVSASLFSADITRVYDRLALPVWLVHGTRGDFVDYRGKERFRARGNWSIDVLEAGALPYFDNLPAFVERYDAFRSGLEAGGEGR